MTATTLPPKRKQMTGAEFLALPDDGVRRFLIKGELYEEGGSEMSYRGRRHSRRTARVTYVLERWSEQQPLPRGEVANGVAGVLLRTSPESMVGIDIAYFSADAIAAQSEETTLYSNPPTLAIEVLSPSNRLEDYMDKVREYTACGIPITWLIEPENETITVYERGKKPRLYNIDDVISAEPYLQGFRIPVSDFFK